MTYLLNLLEMVALASMPADGPSRFREEILSTRSATEVLQKHCRTEGSLIQAEQVPGVSARIPAALRKSLRLAAGETIRHRRVRLMCGDKVFSEADNWYVPSRLTRDMNAALETTKTPFGRVVAPMRPHRTTLEATLNPGPNFLRIIAVLEAEDQRPISAVVEVYRDSVLD